ncbi:hypothetical protein P9314_23040 [Paenibacillus validus]|uniref:Uncharacterized protein n=1 Tax=Paenibacillus validus TaxID=44253 RepID=A0A7X2ZAF5_9BACL|nr:MULTISPECIES: hypothetical protein [Paenibacillus]MED4603507.1 hypothetical protein [Paenibacillus validus]MED4605354.1 hypothetical protein [Paenibacillus validus]MUG71226.1 hypothetical protein [Paenibacillus validus]
MEQYQPLIGVILEKLDQTYKDLQFNYNGLDGIIKGHSEHEVRNTPELITITELRDSYLELLQVMEKRFPGLK